MTICRCIDVGIVSYVVRCIGDDLVSLVSCVSSLVDGFAVSLVSIGNERCRQIHE